MSTKNTARTIILIILAAGLVIVGSLHFFADTGQFAPASATNDATKSDQKGNAVAGPGVPVRTK